MFRFLVLVISEISYQLYEQIANKLQKQQPQSIQFPSFPPSVIKNKNMRIKTITRSYILYIVYLSLYNYHHVHYVNRNGSGNEMGGCTL